MHTHDKSHDAGTRPPGKFKKAMTLVEVMISMFVFSVVVLASFGLLNFGLRTMDTTRGFTQASQILTHEMEAMRLRSFDGDAGINQKSVKYLCDHPDAYASFTAFADYRGGDVVETEKKQPVVGEAVIGKTILQYRNASGSATGFTCKRELSYTNADKDQILVKLTATWSDSRNLQHSRYLSSTVSKHGLNDSIFLIN
jgi:prepilin-type N-terminal cleavage/methylation domain-containing protein